MSGYNTNLASEFWVLSMLYRLGADASLTLGNKKSVDIVIVTDAGRTKTVDVKGVMGPWDWPADNIRLPGPKNHFYVFLSFEGKIDKPEATPAAWIVAASRLNPFLRKYKTHTVVSRPAMRSEGGQFLHGWHRLLTK